MKKYLTLEEICKLVNSRKAIINRYENPQKITIVEHPENIKDGDVLTLDPYENINKRKAYSLKQERDKFYLEEVPVMFDSKDVPEIVKDFFRFGFE